MLFKALSTQETKAYLGHDSMLDSPNVEVSPTARCECQGGLYIADLHL